VVERRLSGGGELRLSGGEGAEGWGGGGGGVGGVGGGGGGARGGGGGGGGVGGGGGGEVVVREPRILSVSIEGDGWVEIDEGGEGEEEEVRIWVIIGGEGGKEFTLNTHACYYTAHFKPYLHPLSPRPHSTFPPVLVSANVTAPSSYSLTSPPPP